MNGFMKFCIGCVAAFVIALVIALQFAHKLENQNLAIVQSMGGDVEVRKTAGWWLQVSPTIWEYPKAGVYRLNGNDGDTLKIQFNNKSTADLNCMIGYRLDSATDEQFIKLHQQVEGHDEKIWQQVLTEVNTISQCIASQYDPSEVIGGEKFPEFVKALAKAVLHNEILLKQGIDVDVFKVDGKPEPDPDTKKQFAEQREAALAKELAKSQIKKLEAETEKERAEAARKTEHEKIEAQAQMAKEKLDFERQKQNETITAEKRVALAELAKKEAEVKANQEAEVAKVEANKVLVVAEIQKKTEQEKLEIEKLIAEQKKVAADAKKIEIEKSGAITELQRMQLTIDKETKIGVAEAYAKGIAGAKLPTMWVTGGKDGSSASNPIELLIQTMTLEKLNGVNASVPVKK